MDGNRIQNFGAQGSALLKMTSDKRIANWLMDGLLEMGVKTIICSPGSRNAPLVIAATSKPELDIITVLDERSAAFQAIGMAMVQNRPVVVCCTSGSAIANYYPAVLEAFHNRIPLIVLSADRPQDRIMKGEGQTCYQQNFFTPHVGHSEHFDEQTAVETFISSIGRIHEVLRERLPVHINVSFFEPLYQTIENQGLLEINLEAKPIFHSKDWNRTQVLLDQAKAVALIIGQLTPIQSRQFREILDDPGHHLSYFADPTSGLLDHPKVVSLAELVRYEPDAILSFGGQWIDKRPKFHIRSLKVALHVHVDPYQCWDVADAKELIHIRTHAHLLGTEQWTNLSSLKPEKPQPRDLDVPWSDALVAKTLINQLSPLDSLHLANSTAVRYFEWFPVQTRVYSNRGVAGIDGSLSTAVGAALADPSSMHYCLIGDQSFFYDSNALHRRSFPNNLIICVLNNSVGGIFEWLPGVNEAPQKANEVFLNAMSSDIAGLCQAHSLNYQRVIDKIGLEKALSSRSKESLIIDCDTSASENARIARTLRS